MLKDTNLLFFRSCLIHVFKIKVFWMKNTIDFGFDFTNIIMNKRTRMCEKEC